LYKNFLTNQWLWHKKNGRWGLRVNEHALVYIQALFFRRRHQPTRPALAKRSGQEGRHGDGAKESVLTVEGQHAGRLVGD